MAEARLHQAAVHELHISVVNIKLCQDVATAPINPPECPKPYPSTKEPPGRGWWVVGGVPMRPMGHLAIGPQGLVLSCLVLSRLSQYVAIWAQALSPYPYNSSSSYICASCTAAARETPHISKGTLASLLGGAPRPRCTIHCWISSTKPRRPRKPGIGNCTVGTRPKIHLGFGSPPCVS